MKNASSGKWRVAGIGLLVVLATFAVYAPSIGYDFIYLDDDKYIVENPVVSGGFSMAAVKTAWTESTESYWAPLLWMSFMADIELFGMEPWGFHLVNVLLFSMNAGLLYCLVRRWTGRTGVALAVALLWASHPARVESVAWVVERKDVLSGLFILLGIGAYVEGHRGNLRHGLTLAWLCMAIGGMVKQIVIVMPAVMLLLDVWPLERTNWNRVWREGWRLMLEKWAFWALGAAYATLPIAFHVARKAVVSVPAWHRALMIPVHYLFYLGKFAWPSRLMPLQPDIPSWWELLAGGMLVLGWMTWLAWRQRRRFPLALWGWLWFAVLLFPLSGVVWAGAERVATRWIYLPQIGLILAATVVAADWIRASGRPPRWGVAACVLVLAIWGGLSLSLSRHWRSRDHFGIWAYTCNPGHPVACMLGGDAYLARKDWAKAAEAYEMGSSFWEPHCFLRLCMIWNCCGFPELTDDAWPRFEKGLGMTVLEAVADERPIERIFAWRLRGQCMQARGDLRGALAAFKEAATLEGEPSAFVVAEYLRTCHEAGQFGDEAQAVAARMTQVAGEDRGTWDSLFPCYAQIWRDGARGYAYGYFLEYAKRRPDDAVGFNNMAWLLATSKPMEIGHAREEEWPAKAVEWAERAVESDAGKNAAMAWDTLGTARANAGDFAGAIEAASQALALARKEGGVAMAAQIEARLAGYRAGKPWRE